MPLWFYSSASSADADAAVAAASAAFPVWSKTKPAGGGPAAGRAKEFQTHMIEETGSGAPFAQFDVFTAADHIRDAAGRISSIAGSIPICKDEGTSALVLKEPYGVILSIAPWNAVHILGVRSVLFTIATGNTCPSLRPQHRPRFHGRGSPPGVLNIIYTTRADSPAITAQLIAAPAIRKINFTGSTAVGAAIAAAAGKALRPCLLELGGKAAAIVLEDADLERAATQCVICMATERILVCASVMDAFRPLLKQAIAGFAPAEGPAAVLVQGSAVKRNRALVADALSKGATLLHGDHMVVEGHPEMGMASETRMRLVVVEGVTAEMALYREESFGPSVSVIAVKDEEEAIAISNASEYGLNGAVFTRDLARGIRVAKRLECGSVHINSITVHDEAVLPHGGVKSSTPALTSFLRSKTITFQE
ncbi:Aldehyde/histidinol dehydrogenase [Mycena metata]|uniref:Aldehyde/histidinol dehydrogenase n=1 Tax=Mycena metata TaxID=1033252 RepID=A0AAD7NAX2_9AGAR|nr:Aldehyde/histidinol dehydrogenase [Mycena metata]